MQTRYLQFQTYLPSIQNNIRIYQSFHVSFNSYSFFFLQFLLPIITNLTFLPFKPNIILKFYTNIIIFLSTLRLSIINYQKALMSNNFPNTHRHEAKPLPKKCSFWRSKWFSLWKYIVSHSTQRRVLNERRLGFNFYFAKTNNIKTGIAIANSIIRYTKLLILFVITYKI